METSKKSNIWCAWMLSLLMAVLGSCADDIPELPPADSDGPLKDYITLKVKCAEPATRVTEEGLEEYNENLIKSVTVCLWPNGGDWLTDKEPMYFETFSSLDAQDEAIVRLPLTQEMINHLFNQDSDNTCQAFVAVNVNPGDAKTVDQLRALSISSTFDSQTKQESFAMDGDGTVKLNVGADGSVYASGEIKVRRSAAKVDLHIKLPLSIDEVMADGTKRTWKPNWQKMKVTLRNGVKSSTLDPNPSGIPEDDYYDTPTDLEYGFTNRSKAGWGDAAYDSDYPYEQIDPFYTYPNKWDATDEEDSGRTFMLLVIPWTYDGKNYKDCYYRVQTVSPSISELVRNTSYHVKLEVGVLGSFVPDDPMPVEGLSYVCAPWGEEKIDVNITQPRYLVVNQNTFEVNNEEEIVIPFYTSHNTVVTEATMTFTRFNFSDEGTAFDITVTQEQNEKSFQRVGEYVFECNFNMSDTTLVVKHPLKVFEPWKGDTNRSMIDLTNGDISGIARSKTQTPEQVNKVLNQIKWYKKTDVDEYSKVVFRVTVQHEDMRGTNNFSETVTITQYPGMYIDAIQNYVESYMVDDVKCLKGSGAQGSVYINNNTSDKDTKQDKPAGAVQDGYMTSIGLSTGYLNWNPNLYLVTISRLPNQAPYNTYIISDPRSSNIDNDLSDVTGDDNYIGKNARTSTWGDFSAGNANQAGAVTAKALYPNSTPRKLSYYYPTIESNDYLHVISPKFRICSSYAGTGAILTRMLARRRGAAFQEMGYAAGRWRLPTYAEVEFVMKLAADYKIPRLFGRSDATTWQYWCAQGAVNVPGKTASGSKNPSLSDKENSSCIRARFVYDEWYWGSTTLNRNGQSLPNARWDFTWGDQQR